MKTMNYGEMIAILIETVIVAMVVMMIVMAPGV